MATTVINIKDAPPNWHLNNAYVYIGRSGRGLNGKWGNPFVLTGLETRTSVLSKYKRWFYSIDNTELRERAGEFLANKILVCFCAPKECHGDVIASYVNDLHFGL